MRWSCIWLVLFVSLGCAEGEDLSDSGVVSGIDALFGCTVGLCDGPPTPPVVDAGGPPRPPTPTVDQGVAPDPEPMIPDDCDPGTRIADCALCNLQGMPEMPETDAMCPPIDCGGEEVYERVIEDEEEVCYVTRRTPLAGNCRALGECHDDPLTLCGEPSREEVERIPDSPCILMMGCEGDTPPTVEMPPLGTPCNNTGLCNIDGECSVDGPPADCGGFFLQGRSQFCEGGTEAGGEPYCEFYLEPGGDTDCNTFCLANNWRCIRAWNDNGVCRRQNNEEGCGADFSSHICRCIPL